MKVYAKGDSVQFKTPHGSIVDGTVYDCNENAVMISTNFGTYSVAPSQILSGGTWKKIQVTHADYKNDFGYDIGWWDNGEDEETF